MTIHNLKYAVASFLLVTTVYGLCGCRKSADRTAGGSNPSAGGQSVSALSKMAGLRKWTGTYKYGYWSTYHSPPMANIGLRTEES
jgi:hypothetical protein